MKTWKQSIFKVNVKKLTSITILIFTILIIVLSIAACGLFFTELTEHFGNNLQGTWKSADPSYPGFDGKLVIDYNAITISGYQGEIGSNPESKRPFTEFSKGVPLKGYSDTSGFLDDNYHYSGNTGTLYIKEQNIAVKEIYYKYFITKNFPQSMPNNQRYLYVCFAGWEDTLIPDDES